MLSYPRVQISNYNRQHSFHAAIAADSAGCLKELITSFAYRRDLGVVKMLQRSRRFHRVANKLVGRQLALSDAASIRTILLPELGEAVASQIAPRSTQSLRYLRAEAFDRLASRHVRGAEVFHGFEQCAAHSLRAAHRSGIVAILDQSIVAWPTLSATMRDRHAYYAVPLDHQAPFFDAHVERKIHERTAADYFLAGLESVRDSLVAAGVDARRVFLLPYGAPMLPQRAPGKPLADPPHLLFVGPASWQKGLPDLLSALIEVQRPVRLSVVGRTNAGWSSVLDRLAGAASARGHHIRMRGAIPQAQLLREYHEADVFVFPSHIGGVGLATLEAMSAGVPVITSSGDGLLTPGVHCLAADPRSAGALATAIERILSDALLRESIALAGQQVAQRFSWNSYAAGLVECYSIASKGGDASSFIAPALRS